MFNSPLFHRTFIGLAIFTAFGVLVHDTKFDQATTVALAIPLGLSLGVGHAVELKGEGHTHVERAAFEKSSQKTNAVPPRTDNRKYLLARHARGFNTPEPHTLVYNPALA